MLDSVETIDWSRPAAYIKAVTEAGFPPEVTTNSDNRNCGATYRVASDFACA
jgi:hypothetical protein